MARRHVARILAEKEAWLRRQLKRQDALSQSKVWLGLDRQGVVWLHGEPVPIEIVATERGPRAGSTARLKAGTLVVYEARADATLPLDTEDAILRWYRREAWRRIGALVEHGARDLGVTPARLTIRDPRTRWGSCSSLATLSFSWRLLLAPLDVLDYVVLHELCHLRELNHSAAFWSLVEQARPEYRQQLGWLRRYGRELHEYRPALSRSG